jgi:pimeloyl-ACP methyl ester carboxylesterase
MLGVMHARSVILASLALLPFAVPAPAALAQGTDPSQTATLKVFLQGNQVGTEQFTVSRSAGGWLISGTSSLGPPAALALRRAEARYSAEWHARELVLQGTLRELPIDLETRFDGGQAVSRFLQTAQQATQTQEKRDAVSPEAVVLPNNFFAAYAALPPRLAGLAPGGALRAYVAPQAEIVISYTGLLTEKFQTTRGPLEVRRHQIALQNPGGAVNGEVWADPSGRLLRVSIPGVGLDVVREDLASVSTRRVSVERPGDETVRIPANGFTLAGTLSVPPVGGWAPGKLPAIVLVGGSGPVDRDEAVAGIPVFGQLAGALADAGFLVLRYDKRGVGQSGGRIESATVEDFAEDVRSAVRFLADRPNVNDKAISVVGHSEGAWAALAAAASEKRIARVVLMAGPGSTGAQLVLEQQRHLLARSGMSEAERAEKIALQERIQKAVRSGGGWDGIPPDLRKQAEAPWFRSFLSFDPAPVMRRTGQPILVVQAEFDRQVPAHHGETLASLARGRKARAAVELVTVPGVNHLFVPAKTGEVDEYPSLAGSTISPALPAAIVKFL